MMSKNVKIVKKRIFVAKIDNKNYVANEFYFILPLTEAYPQLRNQLDK
jgi:hypothetical protein